VNVRMRLAISCMSIVLLTSFAVRSDGFPVQAPCSEARTTKEIVDCFQTQVDEVNRQLDELGRSVQALLPASDQALFREASGAWAEYRRANCNCATAESEGGSLESVGTLVCWLRMTKDRIEEVQTLFSRQLKDGLKGIRP